MSSSNTQENDVLFRAAILCCALPIYLSVYVVFLFPWMVLQTMWGAIFRYLRTVRGLLASRQPRQFPWAFTWVKLLLVPAGLLIEGVLFFNGPPVIVLFGLGLWLMVLLWVTESIRLELNREAKTWAKRQGLSEPFLPALEALGHQTSSWTGFVTRNLPFGGYCAWVFAYLAYPRIFPADRMWGLYLVAPSVSFIVHFIQAGTLKGFFHGPERR